MARHRPRKRFGQNFLESESVIRRLVAAIAPQAEQCMVEIGPGLGALTKPLLEKLAHLHVIELDRDLAAGLTARLGQPNGLTIHQADALKFDFASLDGNARLRVVGNLPYNISTPLMFHLLSYTDAVQDMHFMLQKEVVDRLTAGQGGKSYGRLSVMTQVRAYCEKLFDVPPEAFRPAPKVDSAVVRIVPKTLTQQQIHRLPALEHVVRKAFSQRRKTLRNTLRDVIEPSAMEKLSIDPGRRAETLSLDEFEQLADCMLDLDSHAEGHRTRS